MNIDKNTCVIFSGSKNEQGYGRLTMNGRGMGAHRYAYEQARGPIPPGLVIDHLCRNPACVNPDHLEAVTQRENLLRGETHNARNVKKTHCPQGHPYDEANTRHYAGGRYCRACARAASRKYRATSPNYPENKRAQSRRERAKKKALQAE